MAPMHRHDSPLDALDLRLALGARLRQMAARLRGACSDRSLQSFTMLLPDGQLAKSCCQRLGELIGYHPAGDGEANACSG